MNINEIIAKYNEVKEEKSKLEKEEKQLKSLIEQYANGKNFFETENYNVVIDCREQKRIDEKKLLEMFPDIKNEIGKTITFNVITAKEKQQIKKTA